MPISQYLFQCRGDLMRLKSLFKNDDAVSISVGFILMLSITVLVFSITILSFYTLSQQSEKLAMQRSFEILGSELAVKITTVDMLASITGSYEGTVNIIEYDFSIPASIAGRSYTVNITDASNRVIILEADNGAKAWIPYNTSEDIQQPAVISSISEDYKIIYEDELIKIEP